MSSFNSKGYLDMELLRFTTAGSVDDGKSTLIGRLLYDSKSIFEDQMEAIKLASERRGEERVNLALLTDGLRAEREQGITIDVAYRYFATPKRKFIIADTPGHIQYTRNMVTGASTANLTVILLDARKGVIEQTRRHTFIASLLRIPHLVVCINKMDLVEYSEEVYNNIQKDFQELNEKLDISDVHFIPISALHGDNIVNDSKNMDWYQGPTLLHLLETIPIDHDENLTDARFPVQYIIRPQNDKYHDFRGYAGRVAGGVFKKGDEVIVLPKGIQSRIKSVYLFDEEIEKAVPPMSVNLLLEDDIDISRGDMIVKKNNMPIVSNEFDVMICWMNEKPLQLNGKYFIRHTTKESRCIVKNIHYKIDINTLQNKVDDTEIAMNDIGRISIKTMQPFYFDNYKTNRSTGSIILIDEGTNETVGAGMIL